MKNDGGPAFPQHYSGTDFQHIGMSLRDYIAIHASEDDIGSATKRWLDRPECTVNICSRETARYYYADLILTERKKAS